MLDLAHRILGLPNIANRPAKYHVDMRSFEFNCRIATKDAIHLRQRWQRSHSQGKGKDNCIRLAEGSLSHVLPLPNSNVLLVMADSTVVQAELYRAKTAILGKLPESQPVEGGRYFYGADKIFFKTGDSEISCCRIRGDALEDPVALNLSCSFTEITGMTTMNGALWLFGAGKNEHNPAYSLTPKRHVLNLEHINAHITSSPIHNGEQWFGLTGQPVKIEDANPRKSNDFVSHSLKNTHVAYLAGCEDMFRDGAQGFIGTENGGGIFWYPARAVELLKRAQGQDGAHFPFSDQNPKEGVELLKLLAYECGFASTTSARQELFRTRREAIEEQAKRLSIFGDGKVLKSCLKTWSKTVTAALA